MGKQTKKETARSVIARPMVGNAEATFGGFAQSVRLEVKLGNLSTSDRRAMFSALLHDPEIVTVEAGTPAGIALSEALVAACSWETP